MNFPKLTIITTGLISHQKLNNMRKKLYEIKEYNNNEGETFGYIILLSDEEFEKINKFIAKKYEVYDESFSIKECTLSSFAEYLLINRYSDNSYMDRLTTCELSERLNIDDLYEGFLYKMNGLTEIHPKDIFSEHSENFESLKAKAEKWDLLGDAIATCYPDFDEEDNELSTEFEEKFGVEPNLCTIGEIAASHFGYL